MSDNNNNNNVDLTAKLGDTGDVKRKHGTLVAKPGKQDQFEIDSSASGSEKKAVLASKTV